MTGFWILLVVTLLVMVSALAEGLLFAIVASLYAFVRSEVGYRILQTQPAQSDDLFHEPMV